jgi:hypothetical protein
VNIQELKSMYVPTITIMPNYIPAPLQPCPSCGRCPHCGKGGYDTRPHWNPYWPGNSGINPYPNIGGTVYYNATNMPQTTYTLHRA